MSSCCGVKKMHSETKVSSTRKVFFLSTKFKQTSGQARNMVGEDMFVFNFLGQLVNVFQFFIH